jgi:anthranilate/para-aminobenzoate synthase component I
VLKAKRYITEGDIMQVVLSQRMSKPLVASPMALYRSLRSLNPSPYMFYFDFEDFHVVGASPEILVRLEGDTVTVRPIAGTRRRGVSFDEDQALAAELLADEKERAEHVQLLDLGRNDAGRVARVGTIKLTENMIVERYSHVMHIVSNVEANCSRELNALDVLKATFPAGTVSGAPKVRAMEIIDELEPVKRGIYAGASATSASTATWIWRSRSAPPSSRTASCTCRPVPASSPIPTRRFRMAGNAEQGAAPCCAPPNWPKHGLDTREPVADHSSADPVEGTKAAGRIRRSSVRP